MGENRWREADRWPPAGVAELAVELAGGAAGEPRGRLLLDHEGPVAGPSGAAAVTSSAFVADPSRPVSDPHSSFGPHDYRALIERDDLLVFETAPLAAALTIAGATVAELLVSCDCADFDLWAKLFDVWPSGAAYNLMSPGADVLRARYRDGGAPSPVPAGEVVRLRFDRLYTAHRFAPGHRLRLVVAGSFFPHFSRNLQTGESEATTSRSRLATIRVHHGAGHRSRLLLPQTDRPPPP
jgi:hypothetical protein